jgi:hypothetical protein
VKDESKIPHGASYVVSMRNPLNISSLIATSPDKFGQMFLLASAIIRTGPIHGRISSYCGVKIIDDPLKTKNLRQ